MASTKRATGRAKSAPPAAAEEPSKAQLQRRMEEAREDISQTVEEIKETVTEQYESVKETVAETFDWRAQFRKHSVAWSLGALAAGYVVGTGLAAALKDTTKQQKGRRSHGLLDDLYAYGEMLAEEFSGVAQTVILPLINKKVKDTLGIDLSDKLLTTRAARAAAGKRPAKKAAKKSDGKTKKSGGKKGAAKKSAVKKGAAKKGGSK
jgi:histone H1/5